MHQPARSPRSSTIPATGSIHARAVRGHYNSLRWAMVWLTQLVFYGACWLPWQAEGITRQAILFDIPHEKFYVFGLVLWPQDALLLAILLIAAATALFLVTALAGRLFCGFACPQTVYTLMFSWIEARVEGDHLARRKLDQAPWSPRKLGLKFVKHALWIALAGWTGITFVGYFTPIRELLGHLPGGQLGPWEGFWVGFYALFMYLQAGFAREAVCQHMCPYSRFQGVMIDEHTRSIGYDQRRGEPRAHRGSASAAGDCVDCGICVQVCPTGIDIRDGLQYACINCGLCADACDEVMTRTGRATGLIRFAPLLSLNPQGLDGPAAAPRRIIPIASAPAAARPAGKDSGASRPRLRPLAYASLLGVLSLGAAATLAQRSEVLVNVLRDRNTLARETADARIENSYTVKIANLAESPREFQLAVRGLPGIELVDARPIHAAAGSIQAVQLTVSAPRPAGTGPQQIAILVTPSHDPAAQVVERSTFLAP